LVLGGEVEDYAVKIVRGRPPVAVNDNYWILEDPALVPDMVSDDEICYRGSSLFSAACIVPRPNVLSNDTDTDGDARVGVILVQGPQHAAPGRFQLHEDGTFDYYPAENFNGEDTFTYRVIDNTGLVSNNVATVRITVHPKNDAPAIDLTNLNTTPANLVVEEDAVAGLTFRGIVLSDLDDILDPNEIELQVTLSVSHGGLLLDTSAPLAVVGIPVMAQDDTKFPQILDADPSLVLYQTVTVQGTIAVLNARLDGLVYYGDHNFHTMISPTNDEALIIHVDDLNNTEIDPDAEPMIARATLPITVLAINDAPTIDVPTNLANTLDEDDPVGLLLVDPDGIGITVYDLDVLHDPGVIELQVTVGVLHGGLRFHEDFDDLVVTVVAADTTGWEPLVSGTFEEITIRGTIQQLNDALATLRYWNDAHFNSGARDDELTVYVTDLGNSDYRTPGAEPPDLYAETAEVKIAITVRPTQDDPKFDTVPGTQQVDEWSDPGQPTFLDLPAFVVFDVDARSALDAPYLVYDPEWQGTITISVNYGRLQLNDQGLSSGNPYLVDYVVGTRQIEFTGTLDALNQALSADNVRYWPDLNFNSRNWIEGANDLVPHDELRITFNDLGNTDYRNLDADPLNDELSEPAVATVTIIVNPKQNAPEVVTVPATQVVDESDDWWPLSQFEVFDVDARDSLSGGQFEYDPDWVGEVTLSVVHGTLKLEDVGALESYAGEGTVEIRFTGSLDALNAALTAANVLYKPDQNFNSGRYGERPDVLTITISDLGDTDIVDREDRSLGKGGTTEAESHFRTVDIIVRPTQDDPKFDTVPGTQQVDEWSDPGQPTFLDLPAFVVFDVDARSALDAPYLVYDPEWQGTITISVNYGRLQLNDQGLSSGNPYLVDYVVGTRQIEFTGTLDALNQALSADNVRYWPDLNFNSRNWIEGANDLVPHDELRITFNDLGNTDYRNLDADPLNDELSEPAVATVTIIVNPKQNAPEVVTVPATQVVDESDDWWPLSQFEVFDVDARDSLSGGQFEYDPDWVGEVTLSVVHGTLKLEDVGALESYAGEGTVEIRFTGSLDALNAALTAANVLYKPDQNFNSGRYGERPDVLTITISDLGDTDIVDREDRSLGKGGTTEAESHFRTVDIIVRPTQDDPKFDTVPGTQQVDEWSDPGQPTFLDLPAFVVFDVDARSALDAPYLVYDPEWQGTITISVNYGRLQLNDQGLSSGNPYLVDYVVGTRQIEFTGTLDALNQALSADNVRYWPDLNFNSRNWIEGANDLVPHDELRITFNDLGNTDYRNLDADPLNDELSEPAVATVTIIVNPKQSRPEIPVVPAAQFMNEDTVLALPRFEVFDVDARSRTTDPFVFEYDPDWVGRVTITVRHGELSLVNDGGLSGYAGHESRTITLTGGLTALNDALAASNVQYKPDLHYNSGNPRTGPVTPDRLTITIHDLWNTDILYRADSALGKQNPAGDGLSFSRTVDITVRPKQDAPTIPTVPPDQQVDEDAVLQLPAFQVFDVDARSSLVVGANTLVYDPAWTGTVKISVLQGTVWLHDPAGVAYTGDRSREITLTGGLNALNHALRKDNVRYQGDLDYNSWTPEGVYVPDILTIEIDDRGNTDIQLNVERKVNEEPKTVLITVLPINDPPEILVPDGLARTVDEDDLDGLGLVDPDGVGIAVDDPDRFHYPVMELQVTLEVKYGGLLLDVADVEIVGTPVMAADDGIYPRVLDQGAGLVLYQWVTVRGMIDPLNQALQGLRYYGDRDFNTGTLAETLTVTVNDLGYVDKGTLNFAPDDPKALPLERVIPLTVLPINDAPTIAVPENLAVALDEDHPAGLLLVDSSGGPAVGIQVADLDDLHDPADVRLQVTLQVQHGGLLLANPAGVTINAAASVLASADGLSPLRAGTYQRLVFTGTIANLNAALRTLTYYNDRDFNTARAEGSEADLAFAEWLTVDVNDLGYTDKGTVSYSPSDPRALPAVAQTVTLTVRPTNDAPAAQIPAGISATLDEDDPAGLRLVNTGGIGVTVSDVDDAYDPDVIELQVLLAVRHGGLTIGEAYAGMIDPAESVLASVAGLEPLQPGTYRRLVFTGTIAALNEALESLTYYNDHNFNTSRAPAAGYVEWLTVDVNDQGYSDWRTVANVPTDARALTAVTRTVALTVLPANDPPTITIPDGLATAVEEDAAAGLLLVNAANVGIKVDDPDDRYDPADIELQVRLDVLHGGLKFGSTSGLMLLSQRPASATGSAPFVAGTYESILMQGTIANLNAALATLRYFGDAHFNTATLDEVLGIWVNDLGYSDKNTVAHEPEDPRAKTAVASVTLTVLPVNDAPVINLPAGLRQTLDEDSLAGLPLLNPQGAAITVADLDDIHDPADIRVQLRLSVRHGGLFMNPNGTGLDVVGAPVLAQADGSFPRILDVDPTMTLYQTVTLEGTIADLNQALTTLVYYGDRDFNTDNMDLFAEVLTLRVDDLGNTDYRPGQNLFAERSVTLTVLPINDPPTILLPANLATLADEDDPAGLLLVGDAGVGIRVDDLDDTHDRLVVEMRVTLDVLYGGLLFGDQTGLTVISSTPATASGGAPRRAGTFQSLTVQGTLAGLNAALATLRYFGDADFNSGGAQQERVRIQVNDLAYSDKDTLEHLPTDAKVLTASATVALTVRPTNDPPTITVPANLKRGVLEGAPAGLWLVDPVAGVNGGIRVADVDDLLDPGIELQVTLSVLNGGLTMNESGVTVEERVPADADGIAPDSNHVADSDQSLTFRGTIAQLNAALATLRYYGDLNFNTGVPGNVERLVIQVDDLGNTDYRPDRREMAWATVTITVVPVNDPPVLSDVPLEATIPELSPYTFTATATDVDLPAQTLTFSLLDAPAGAAIDPATGVFTWTPSEAQGPGEYTFTVRVSDGVADTDQAIAITVTEVNEAPVLLDVPATATIPELSLYTFTANATDSDLPAQTLTFSLLDAPAGAAIGATSGVFAWTPSEAQGPGEYTFTVRVSDGVADTDQAIAITVTEVNHPPVLDNVPDAVTIAELSLYTFTAAATDPDIPAQTLTFSLLNAPAGAQIDSASGEFTWTPGEEQGPGEYAFTVRVSDGVADTDQAIAITVTEVNHPPVLEDVPDAVTIDELSLYTFTAAATDIDVPAQTLTFSLLDAPAGAAIDAASGVFTWTPSEAQGPGEYTITVRVTDDGSPALYAEQAIAITVTEVNHPPVFDNVPDAVTIAELSLYTFTAAATDSDLPAQALTFSLLDAPAGAAIDAASGVFTWTPSEAQGPGEYTITVRVTDNGSPALYAEQVIAITVTEVNHPPVLDSVPDAVTIAELSLYTFTAAATDSDLPAQALTFSLLDAPAGAAIDAASGVFTWTPSEAQGPGEYTITVRVTDNGSPALYAEQVIAITVTEVNHPPVLDNVPDAVTIAELSLYAFTAAATDIDRPAQTLTFSLLDAPAGAAIDAASGVFTWTPSEAQGAGEYTFTVRVTDDGSPALYDERAITITVTEVNHAPVLGNVPDAVTIPELSPYTFTAAATDPDIPVQTLTFSLLDAPAGAAIGATNGVFTWTPSEAQGPGEFTFTVRVSDGVANTDQEVTIAVTEVNAPPVLLNVPATATIPELSLYTFTANATDSDLPAQTLTFSLLDAPAGAAIGATNGVFTWTPSEVQGPGEFTFTVRVSDGAANTDQDVTIAVTEVNAPPVLLNVPATATIPELSLYTFTANATDSDLPAQTLTFSLLDAPAGAAIGATNGVFTWTPSEAQGPGEFTFTVRVSDGVANTDQGVTIAVTEVNAPPVLLNVPATATIPELSLYTFTAIATDSDLPAQTLTFSLLDAPAGAAIGATNGVFTWTPSEAQGPGEFTFTVRVSDGVANTDQEVTIAVAEVNHPPVLLNVPATATIPELSLYTFTANATDSDLPVQTLTFSLLGAPAGAAIGATSGVFAWTPSEAQGPGEYTFTVRVSDGVANTDQGVTIAVTEVNAPPVLLNVPATATIPELSLYTFTAIATDSDLPVQTLTFSLLDAPAGAAIGATNGVFAWTPSEAQGPGEFTFTVRVSDGVANTDQGVTIAVTEVNAPPVLLNVPATATIPELSLYTFTANATDSDLPAQGLTFSLLGAPAGAAIGATNGVFAWTPSEAQGPGEFTFTVRVSDGVANTDQGVTISVTEVNAPPVLLNVPATATIPELSLYTFTANATDSDLPAQGLTFSLLGAPAGAAIGATNGVFAWTPSEAQGPGEFTFTVRVSDGVANTDQGVTISVTEVNAPPVLLNVPATATIPELSLYTFTANATDSDLPAQGLTFSLLGAPAGAAIGATNGVFTWTPSEAQGPGEFTFTVRVSDGVANTDQDVTIAVAEVNHAPVLLNVPAMATIPELSLYTFTVNATDSDLPAQTLTFSLLDAPAGAVIGATNGLFAWTPSEAQGPGEFTFTVRVSDGVANTDQEVMIAVTEVNAPPVLLNVPATATIPELSLYTFTANATDSDLPVQTLTFSLLGAPAGAAIDASSGQFTWTPSEEQAPGEYTITVRVSDGVALAEQAVTITVTEVNHPPVAVDDSYLGIEDWPVTVPAPGVLANDMDPDGDALTVVLADGPQYGELTLDTDGSFTYTPDPDYHGIDRFTYRAYDGEKYSNIATVVLNIFGINDPPLATDDNYFTEKNTELTVTAPGALENDVDVDGDPLTAKLVAGPSHGVLELNSDGSFTYVPNADFQGVDSFTYQANDGTADSNVATVTITISALHPAPEVNVPSAGTTYSSTPTPLAAMSVGNVSEDDSQLRVTISAENGNLIVTTSVSGVTVTGSGGETVTFRGSLTAVNAVLESGSQIVYAPWAGFAGDDLITVAAEVLNAQGLPISDTGSASFQMVVQAAETSLYQNQSNPFDVNGDGMFTPFDVLLMINYINTYGSGELPEDPPEGQIGYLDVNGDGGITPQDILAAINQLNQGGGQQEGEAVEFQGTVSPVHPDLQASPVLGPTASQVAVAMHIEPQADIRPAMKIAQRSVADPRDLAMARDDRLEDWDDGIASTDSADWDELLTQLAIGDADAEGEAATDWLLGSIFGR
jgi:hypothetical protein